MDPALSPIDCEADARKRVCKACDRCRIKKSKCDGKKPCSRCKNDDAICVFGGRKKKSDRVHPKGYVEILERQHKQLVKGIRAIYDRHLSGQNWDGPLLDKGYPPTHEILEYLGALDVEDSSEEFGSEEENNHFEDSLHMIRKSISTNANTQSTLLPPNKKSSRDLAVDEKRPVPSFQASDLFRSRRSSLTTDETWSSSSIDSQHWSTSLWLEQKQSSWDENRDTVTTDSPVKCLGSPLHIDDPFLSVPWGYTEEAHPDLFS